MEHGKVWVDVNQIFGCIFTLHLNIFHPTRWSRRERWRFLFRVKHGRALSKPMQRIHRVSECRVQPYTSSKFISRYGQLPIPAQPWTVSRLFGWETPPTICWLGQEAKLTIQQYEQYTLLGCDFYKSFSYLGVCSSDRLCLREEISSRTGCRDLSGGE
jgi:hypothetical protein